MPQVQLLGGEDGSFAGGLLDVTDEELVALDEFNDPEVDVTVVVVEFDAGGVDDPEEPDDIGHGGGIVAGYVTWHFESKSRFPQSTC